MRSSLVSGVIKHNYFNVIMPAFGYGAVLLLVVTEREDQNICSINQCHIQRIGRSFKPKLHDRIQVSHKYKWNFHIFCCEYRGAVRKAVWVTCRYYEVPVWLHSESHSRLPLDHLNGMPISIILTPCFSEGADMRWLFLQCRSTSTK